MELIRKKKSKILNIYIFIHQLDENDQGFYDYHFLVQCEHGTDIASKSLRSAMALTGCSWAWCQSCLEYYKKVISLDKKVHVVFAVKCETCGKINEDKCNNKIIAIELGIRNGYKWDNGRFLCRKCLL